MSGPPRWRFRWRLGRVAADVVATYDANGPEPRPSRQVGELGLKRGDLVVRRRQACVRALHGALRLTEGTPAPSHVVGALLHQRLGLVERLLQLALPALTFAE